MDKLSIYSQQSLQLLTIQVAIDGDIGRGSEDL
jgi:hypothetical protein